jgi:hypothetical protein
VAQQQSAASDDHAAQVRALYQSRNPSAYAAGKADELLMKYKGREKQLLYAVRKE